jgi:peptidoglycan/xylan/chitin deacetylase (PgdA/CDA1 family)
MRWPGHKLVQQTVRKARSRWVGGIAVLGYHRVAETSFDPLGLAVSPGRFFDQMQLLASRAHVIRLSDAVQAARSGAVPRPTVVVTFDDGYCDTLETALPIIEAARIPVTVFVTTGYPGREFWWDELTRILTHSAAARRDTVAAVAADLQTLPPVEREHAMRTLRASAAACGSGGEPPRARALTVDEIQRLAASPYVELGAHTVTHPMLPALTVEAQRDEVRESRRLLQEMSGTAVTSFSYPHGAYSADTVSIAAEAGFTAACCSEPDVIRPGCDPLRLPRLWVMNHDHASFGRWLDSWLC